MNLRQIAEWMGYTVITVLVNGTVVTDLPGGRDGYDAAWNPLTDWRDCGPVLAKLCQIGVFRSSTYNPAAFCTLNPERWSNGDWVRSETIVTDDATLRKAICEIAEKVSGA